ncbi:hypothetical protein [Streptomyces sp. NPDC058495]|uniref:hypothetical protein n=1 Tax=unclassified Streptomyces TaxID=2593676 RepID=UPI0036591655
MPYDDKHPTTPGNGHESAQFLLDRVRFDLASAGFHVAPPQSSADEDQGGVAVYLDDNHQVTVDWLTHRRLDAAALDMVEANRPEEDVVTRYDTVRTTMNTALGTVLRSFGYQISRPLFGSGFAIQPPHITP